MALHRSGSSPRPVRIGEPWRICPVGRCRTAQACRTGNPSTLGFGNQWYPEVIGSAETLGLGNDVVIRVVTAPMFVVTKIEAFEGRGKGDFYGSQDIEDLVAVIDGREGLIEELRETGKHVRKYIGEHFARYAGTKDFRNALPGFTDNSARESIIADRIAQLAALAGND